MDDDVTAVRTLRAPEVSKVKDFSGLKALKVDKKDRHMKELHMFAKFLEKVNENVVQEVLDLTRTVRGSLEDADKDVYAICKLLEDDTYLLSITELELLQLRKDLIAKIAFRSSVVEGYAYDIDYSEVNRGRVASIELKNLVDRLIAIAHKLPDDIEHIVEDEAFELNTEIITNRKSHLKVICEMRISQVQFEAEILQKWEDARVQWRRLKHKKALSTFIEEIESNTYFDPADRQAYMERFRNEQNLRRRDIQGGLDALTSLTSHNIVSDIVVDIQQQFTACAENEIDAIKQCNSRLNDMKEGTEYLARERVEALRHELHRYGALKLEPDVASNAALLEEALNQPHLAELWRLGGGLKTEFQGQIADLRCDEIIYDRLTSAMETRMELILCSFDIKQVFEKRGRGASLDKMKNYITKMRSLPKVEVAGVLRSMLPDLEDIADIEEVPALFKGYVKEVVEEMHAELAAYETRPITTLQEGALKTLGTKAGGATKKTAKVTLAATGATKLGGTSVASEPYVDPHLVKGWNRKLGILYFGSDLPPEYQQACRDSLHCVKEQQQCNALVDEVVVAESVARLKKISRVYKKNSLATVNFLETQASCLSIVMTNVGDFYLSIAKQVEKHRALQKELDDKSADEIWDLAEEFRFEREDNEAEYEKACQKIRESTKTEDLQLCFQEVLAVLEKIQQSYRNYHSKACFASDKHPLMLINEFKTYLHTLCSIHFLAPQASHPILTEYERIYNDIARFNKPFFDADENATGVPRTPLICGDPPNDAMDEYQSPLLGSNDELAYAGSFRFKVPFDAVVLKFQEEGSFAAPDPNIPDAAEGEGSPVMLNAVLKKEPHPQCKYVTAQSSWLPQSPEAIEAMEATEREEYETVIAKEFLPVDDPATALAPEELELYEQTRALVEAVKERQRIEGEVAYILAHPPLDIHGQQWVQSVSIDRDEITKQFTSIRDNLIVSLEHEAAKKILTSEHDNKKRKTEYTEELEDRIRNHWPRRGRVETQIKQPREAELLGHKEKTWRHIQNIQFKMVELQSRYLDTVKAARKSCDDYIHEMTALRNSLNGEFKNLAVLQGIDVKARGTTIAFQAKCGSVAATIDQMIHGDTTAISVFAKDFRKVCPAQVPGVEGGYSESELNEIEALVFQQCEEIELVSKDWEQELAQLKDQQHQCLKCQDEFSSKYEKCAQDLAMSEGLGQKYGAPRRRAQERIRTEVSRDEANAGRIDELLAQLEFYSAEASRKNSLAAASIEGSVSSAVAANLLANDKTGIVKLNGVTNAWNLLQRLRYALQQRVNYLKVLGSNAGGYNAAVELPWLPAERTNNADLQALAGIESDVVAGSKPTVEELFTDVDAVCRKETKDLYTSEGKAAALGPLGVPDSLHQWLHESKEKILGRGGYRERAWKRFWAQVERCEELYARHLIEAEKTGKPQSEEEALVTVEKYTTKLGVPAVCLRSLLESFIFFATQDKLQREADFAKLLAVWEQGREKHERLLRPRLGSPDMADELQKLNTIELQRSQELCENVRKFRSLLIRMMVQRLTQFYEDIATASRGILLLLDSTIRQEILQVPPDTAVPKKHMTLKKLRKLQKIREEVAQGQEDRSQVRVWAGIKMEGTIESIRAAEDLIVDLGKDPKDFGPAPAAEAPAAGDKKAAAAKKDKAAAPPPAEKPSLISGVWASNVTQLSATKAQVSTAHRIVIQERDSAIEAYLEFTSRVIDDAREKYDLVLQQEGSWNERWQRQVDMLKNGKL